MKALSKSAYARHRGVVPSRVTAWKDAGRLVLTADGKVDVEASDALIDRTNAPRGGGIQKQKGPANAGKQQDEESGTVTLVRAKTAQAAIAAKMAEQDYLTRKGELVERSRYNKALVDALGPILSQLDSLVTRIVVHVPEEDAHRVRVAVEREVSQMRRNLAQTFRALTMGAAGQTRQ